MCGIIGVVGIKHASEVAKPGLLSLQHRGQEAGGIASSDAGLIYCVKNPGLVEEAMRSVDMRARLPGDLAVGHIRYSTSGDPRSTSSIQPFVARAQTSHGRQKPLQLALAHNGNLTNSAELRKYLESHGVILTSRSDTELILPLLMRSKRRGIQPRLIETLKQLEGSYSLLVLTPDEVIAAVDPYGFRPLWYAPYNGGVILASETCALSLFGIKTPAMKEVEPGTVMRFPRVAPASYEQVRFGHQRTIRHCSFECIYFSRPDSMLWGREDVAAIRKRTGQLLAKRHPAKVDLVTAVPDSSNNQALDFARALGVPFEFAIIRNHYTGRNFITPTQRARNLGIRMKLSVVESIVRGRKVAVVDDSLVRSTTMKKVVALLRRAGATEVHVRIAAPPVIHPCRWGIDTPQKSELIAANRSIGAIGDFVKADSLGYITVGDLRDALGDQLGKRYCATCFTGICPFKE